MGITLLLATFVLGMRARWVPQLNVFMLSFPAATLGAGLVMLVLALPSAMEGIQLALRQLGNELVQVIGALGAHADTHTGSICYCGCYHCFWRRLG